MSLHINSKAESLQEGMTFFRARDTRKSKCIATGKRDAQGLIEVKTISTGTKAWLSPNTPILRLLSQDPHLGTAH
jgi:hypothetical protein